jgi:hypothetical protein
VEVGGVSTLGTMQTWLPRLQGASLAPSATRGLRVFLRRRPIAAFLMCLPLILIIGSPIYRC